MAKTLDDEYEFAEAVKFRTLAIMFENQGRRDLSEEFSILVALCEQKEKLLKSLDGKVVFQPEIPRAKLVQWPSLGSFSFKNNTGDN